LQVEANLFLIKTDRDQTYDPALQENVQAGQTERKGVELAIEAIPNAEWRFRANYAYLDATYKKREASTASGVRVDYAGKRIPLAPKHIANFEAAYANPNGFGARVSLRFERDAWLVDYYAASPKKPWLAQNKTLVDLQLSYKINDNYKILFDVKNLLNKKYEGYVSSYQATTGDYYSTFRNPLAIYLTIQMNWDEKKE
jgi:outer membrane receptor protein involved in Fe transport